MTDWNGDWLGDQESGGDPDDDRWNTDWFGDDPDGTIPPVGPATVGEFAIAMENGCTVTYRYGTGIFKAAAGNEKRASTLDHPVESYAGSVILLGEHAVDVRLQLASFAAGGEPIKLGLQHEEVLISDNATGTSLPVEPGELELLDWKNPGQAVLLVDEDEDGELRSSPATIQSTTASEIVVDAVPEGFGLYGGRIMPVMPAYLDPQQDFQRMEVEAEVWSLSARAAVFDFARKLATLELGPLTSAAGLEDATLTERTPGSAPTVAFVGDAGLKESIEESGNTVTIHFNQTLPVHDVADIYALLLTSTLVVPTGTWGSGTMTSGDEFAATALTGGELAGPLGTGATLVEHDGKPVWDFPIVIKSQITDSIHALTEIIDHGGIPLSVGTADMADWGRGVGFSSPSREDFQWLKLFLATVSGCQESWWLPTWRDDLPFVSKAAGTITVRAGKLNVWWPRQRQHIQIWETNETITYAEITAAVYDSEAETWTLTIGTTIATSQVRMVSWLECCRFEKDSFPVTCDQHGRHMAVAARVVQG